VLSANTNNKPWQIKILIRDTGNLPVLIKGYDRSKPNTVYFERPMYTHGTREFYFNLPLSPKKLTISIQNDYGNILGIKFLPFNKKSFLVDRLTDEYVNFVLDFSLKAGYSGTGIYKSKKGNFTIEYLKFITDQNGNIVPTPARIHKENNSIQVSQADFKKMSIPSRAMILLHEFSHNFLNGHIDNESEADINAAIIYLNLGFDVIQSIFAFTRIFMDNDQSYERLMKLDNMINFYIQDEYKADLHDMFNDFNQCYA
jgi:hypothetical protein